MQALLKRISPASLLKLVTRGGSESNERVCGGAHGKCQGASPQVRILGQPTGDVVDERLEWVFTCGFADAGCGDAVDVVADGATVASRVSGDRRDRPTLLVQCVYFHVF
jgi:hypothetical protein